MLVDVSLFTSFLHGTSVVGEAVARSFISCCQDGSQDPAVGLAPDRSLLEMGVDDVLCWQMAEGPPRLKFLLLGIPRFKGMGPPRGSRKSRREWTVKCEN